MTSAKKTIHENAMLPDYRLALAFNFTAADLTANRNGFLSWGQRYGYGRRGQRLLAMLPFARVIRWFSEAIMTQPPRKICGRIRVQSHMYQRDIDAKMGRPQINTAFKLIIEDIEFQLTSAQYQVLSNNNNITYQIFYMPDFADFKPVILSLERLNTACEDEANA